VVERARLLELLKIEAHKPIDEPSEQHHAQPPIAE
jgi:hypothetical protein